ncbi:PilC/PilY family type IV pilus protein [Uliginosibacterium sp. H3]|uniref:PilC/PilY family type IV pilus protein n=1 Tax=Uliginosibacterium silvisoli TaxID=3114758 RepID=A0ABU6K6V7_9RHOO|nr:PilC/PilY family type IV pilus protein [Uliginosibacterium sp. H3]
MNGCFKIKSLEIAILLAFPATAFPLLATAAEPYPYLPPTVTSSVAPNVMLQFDNSGSMKDLPVGKTSGDSKMTIAKKAADKLLTSYPGFRWGLFSFDPKKGQTQNAGVLVVPMSDNNSGSVNTAVQNLSPDTNTPLGETYFEVTNYFAGEASYAGKSAGISNGVYTSPIQYRCQKNFAIVFTDGLSNGDGVLPGLPVDDIAYNDNKPSSPYRSAKSYVSYDASGTAVTKSFKACVDKDTKSDITCPVILDGQTASVADAFIGTDDSDSTFGRSLRDVAMYAYDRDFKVSGLDNSNKSWDDPKFQKQNLTTYTVGFQLKDKDGKALPGNPMLSAAAKVGGGKFFLANDQASLDDAFSTIASEIQANTSNAGGVAVKSETTPAGDVVLQPLFNPRGWYGDLMCWVLGADGVTTTACANPKAIIPSSRTIFTAKVVGTTTTPFDFDKSTVDTNATSAQKLALGADSAAQGKVVDFIRGVEGLSGFRTRPNGLLGDIIDGQPTFVGKPSGKTVEKTYAQFQADNAARSIAFIGANDGMLHAFDVSSMTEIMGFVPSSVYRNLKYLTASDYGVTAGTTPHRYFVNGSSRKADVKLGVSTTDTDVSKSGTWKTVVVGALGQGGRGYHAIDATTAASLKTAKTAIKWEWTSVSDSDLGYTLGQPVIYNVRQKNSTLVLPAVVLSNGYENDFVDGTTAVPTTLRTTTASALFILNVDTGALIKKISLPAGSYGLSAPAGVDTDGDGKLDYVYAGDLSGRMWRFDLTSNDPANWSVNTNPIFNAGSTHPIVMRPGIKVTKVGNDLANMVVFGTGKLLVDSDRKDTTTQSLYGVVDIVTTAAVTASTSSLQKQSVLDTQEKDGVSFRKVSNIGVTLSASARGWYMELPESSERIVASPMMYADKFLVGTGIPLAEACLQGGKGWVMGLNPLTGGIATTRSGATYSIYDLDGSNSSSAGDKVDFSTGSQYVSGVALDAIPTELSFISGGSETGAVAAMPVLTSDANTGSVMALTGANDMAVYSPAEPKGGGVLLVPEIGTDQFKRKKVNAAPSGVKVETGIWREIK